MTTMETSIHAIAGLSSSGVITKVYRNDNGTFEEVASLAGVSYAAIAWGDYDNDGNLDLLVTGFDGSSSYTSVTRLYRNEAGSFVDTNLNIIGITDLGDLAWGDYDNDGKLDFLIGGGTVSGQITKIYRNDVSTANTLPSAPSGLISTFNENIATLAWSKATDNETPQNGLTYNVRIGTTPGGNDVLSSMSLPSGYRLVPKPGNAGARTTLSIKVPTDRTIPARPDAIVVEAESEVDALVAAVAADLDLLDEKYELDCDEL